MNRDCVPTGTRKVKFFRARVCFERTAPAVWSPCLCVGDGAGKWAWNAVGRSNSGVSESRDIPSLFFSRPPSEKQIIRASGTGDLTFFFSLKVFDIPRDHRGLLISRAG